MSLTDHQPMLSVPKIELTGRRERHQQQSECVLHPDAGGVRCCSHRRRAASRTDVPCVERRFESRRKEGLVPMYVAMKRILI